MARRSSPLTHDDYAIACICPTGLEQAPMEALLDEIHPILPTFRRRNSYTLGRMGIHNVVIAAMPGTGNTRAAVVATQLMNDFHFVRFILLVGTGGGVPNPEKGIDIRLGDVVVSDTSGSFGGVALFDRGGSLSDIRFEKTGPLSTPPHVLLSTVRRLRARHIQVGSSIPKMLSGMVSRYPKMKRTGYIHQGVENDRLFRAKSQHHGGLDCRACDSKGIVLRPARHCSAPVIYYGMIGSSNTVVKDGAIRERLKNDLHLLCVETEAGGLMDSFPCLIIRGVSHYADSHKNDRWQPYAAASAAAYAKELLSFVPLLDRQPFMGDLHGGNGHSF
ncbi:pfs domain-containing protein [Aspergillus varians]